MSFARLVVPFLLIGLAFSSIPQLNIAASTAVLNQQISKNLGPKIVNMIIGKPLENLTESTSYGVVKVEVTMTNITISELDIPWKNNILVPKSEYTFRVNLKGITAGLTSLIEGHVSLKKFNTILNILISNINGYVDFKISAPTSASGVGFNLQITYIQIEIDDIDIKFVKDIIDTYVAQTIVSLLRKSIPQLVNSITQNQINPMLSNFCNSKSFITTEIGNHLYEISLNTTEVPKFMNLTYMAIPLDVTIFNVDTGKANDQIDNDHLPLKSFNDTDTLQITLSSGMVNTALWLIQDSNLVDIYIDNSDLGDTAPINLNTTDLKILLPGIAKVYDNNHGVYIHITMSTKTPGLYIRGGRLLVSTALNLQFIVDKKNDKYPRNVTECLSQGQNECVSAVTLNTSLVASVALKINTDNRLFATVQTVKIINAKPYPNTKINVDEDGLKKILNTLIPSMVLPINQQLRNGMDVPMNQTFGYNVTNVMLKTQLDYLATAIKFDFSPV